MILYFFNSKCKSFQSFLGRRSPEG